MDIIRNFLKGGVIGIANIIPGVSGGTMALVLGIYERLIGAIHNISFDTVKSVLQLFRFNKEGFSNFKEEMKRIDLLFLVVIAIGAVVAIGLLAKLMTYLLTELHDPTYGFFFGLVLASVIVPYKLIKKKSVSVFLCMVLSIVSIMTISLSISDEALIEKARHKCETMVNAAERGIDAASENYSVTRILFIFFLGAISISAMILPGVSGSLLLLLLGGYFDVIRALSNWDFTFIFIFGAGCGFGVILFSRILNALLKRWYDQTMGFLLGLVIGSLWMIWPFKNSVVICNKTEYLSNTLPAGFGAMEMITLGSCIVGIAMVALMIKYESKKEVS